LSEIFLLLQTSVLGLLDLENEGIMILQNVGNFDFPEEPSLQEHPEEPNLQEHRCENLKSLNI
jgi:hypothetical protein